MARLYTGTGDKGTTGTLAGTRLSKDHARIRAVGDVDEANAAIGMALAFQTDPKVVAILRNAQNTLFTVGAELSASGKGKAPRLTANHVETLEEGIRVLDAGELKAFVLPRGPPAVASLHLARTVARRAERSCVALGKAAKLNPEVLRYMNRLSSLLFQAAVYVHRREGVPEEHPSY